MPHLLEIHGNSMSPTLKDGQKVNFQEINPSEISRGQIVIFQRENQPWEIKRIIGLPGEKVAFQSGQVLIDGKILDESDYLSFNQTYKYRLANTKEKISVEKEQLDQTIFEEPVLKPDEYYLLGDNRVNSTDSREFGSVQKKNINFLILNN